MTFKNSSTLILAITLSLSLGCAPTTTSPVSSSNGTSSATPTPSPSSTPIFNGVFTTPGALAGTWQENCDFDAINGNSWIESFEFSAANSFTNTTREFSGTACAGTAEFTTQITGTFVLNGLSPTVTNATNLTLNISQIQFSAASVEVVADLILESYCGFINWQVNVAKTIAFGNPCLEGMTAVENTIIGISSNILYFGNDTNTALDTTFGYLRQ